MTEVVPGTLALRRGEERRSILLSVAEGHSFLSSAAGAFSFQRGRCILSSAAGVILFSARAVHSFICGGGAFILVICCRSIFFSARPVHPFICGTGASADQTAAAVGRQNACPAVGSLSMPSATLSRQNRGRWKPFYMSTGRAHELPLLRLRECLASASRNASSSSSKIPRLRLRNCPASASQKYLAFASENALPPLYELPRLHITKFPLSKGKSLVSVAEGHSCHLRRSHFLVSEGGDRVSFHLQPEHSLFSGGGAFSHLRYRSIC